MPKFSSEDYKKFLASAPTTQREFRTIEISHPDFSSTLFFVQDQLDRNLGGQLYSALSMDITEPAERDDADQILTVNLGDVSSTVNSIISQISSTGFFTPVSIAYRKFYSQDTSSPVFTLSLSIGVINFNSYSGVSFTGEDTDFINKSAGEIYTLERFPMLRGV